MTAGLVFAEAQQDDLPGRQDRAHAHGDRPARHVLLAEEIAGRVDPRYAVQVIRRVRLSRAEPGSLKPMWPVRPMPSIWISMPPAVGDRPLVVVAELPHLVDRKRAVGDVDVLRRNIDVVEQILVHEAVIALQLVPGCMG